MGQATSQPDKSVKEAAAASAGFSAEQISLLHDMYMHGVSVQQRTHAHGLGPAIRDFLMEPRADTQTASSSVGGKLPSLGEFVRRIAALVTCTPSELTEFSRFLAQNKGYGIDTMSELVSQAVDAGLVRATHKLPFKHQAVTDSSTSRHAFINFLTLRPVNPLDEAGDVNGSDDAVSPDTSSSSRRYCALGELPEWVARCRQANSIWADAMRSIVFGPPLEPHSHETTQQQTALLPLEACLMLDLAIRDSGFDAPEWTLVFSTKTHGRSWAVFQDAVTQPEASLVLVRDSDGYVFGGFATSPWKPHASFYGTSNAFLCTVAPKMGLFHSTSINANYQYFNQGRQTLPNGLGFGGQLDYFGLWIDASFEHGHSRAMPVSTTYGSPQLSKRAEFDIDYVEVWCIKSPEIDDRYVNPNDKKSILNDEQATALLEMAGKTMHSKNLRQPEPTEN